MSRIVVAARVKRRRARTRNPGVTKESQVLKFKNLINNGGNKEQFYQSLNQSLKEEYGIFSSSDITDSFLNNLLNTIVEVY